MNIIYIQKENNLIIPKQAYSNDAGYDIYAASDPIINGLEFESGYFESVFNIEYETNIYIEPVDLDIHNLVFPRSSISNYNLVLANSVGLIDNKFRGQIICKFKYIFQPEDLIIDGRVIVGKLNRQKIYKKGDKIAQLVGGKTIKIQFLEKNELNETERNRGGFGSSDKKIS